MYDTCMKYIHIVGIAGVIIVSAVAGYALFGREGGVPDISQEGMINTGTQSSFTGSLFDLGTRGGNWKCTVDSSAQTGVGAVSSSGEVHVSGSSVRADFTSTIPGAGKVDVHMITDATHVYTWTSAYPQGFKAKVAAAGTPSATAPTGQGMNASQSYEYQCEKAAPDASLFTPPTSVTFLEM